LDAHPGPPSGSAVGVGRAEETQPHGRHVGHPEGRKRERRFSPDGFVERERAPGHEEDQPQSLTSRVEAEACHDRLGPGNVSDTVTLERARTALDEHDWDRGPLDGLPLDRPLLRQVPCDTW
jgi:hypothetical protein